MQDPRLSVLLKNSYTQSDFAYKIGLLKEFFEFGFFTKGSGSIEGATVDSFSENGTRPEGDIVFLRSLPSDFFASCNKENFQDVLSGLTEGVKKMPLLPITVPIKLSSANFARIGEWVRNEINKNIILKIRIDPSISVGCRFVWNDQLHDLSLSYYLRKERKRLHDRFISSPQQENKK